MAATTTTRKPAARKGAAARAEKKPKAKTVEVCGLTLTLPKVLPGSALFDIADAEMGNDLRGTMGLLGSILGADQYQALRTKIAEDGLDIDQTQQALEGLVDGVLVAYGLSAGE
jgi:hypothetical protein